MVEHVARKGISDSDRSRHLLFTLRWCRVGLLLSLLDRPKGHIPTRLFPASFFGVVIEYPFFVIGTRGRGSNPRGPIYRPLV